MIKILFLINTLGGGGAERVLVNLVNNMNREKYDITVETMFDDGVNRDLLDPNIKYISKKAPCPRGIAYLFRMFSEKQLYRFFIKDNNYDIVVAYMHGAPVKVIAGCDTGKTKKIAWLHYGEPKTGTFFDFWFHKKKAFEAYRKCDAIVGVSKSVVDAFRGYTGICNSLHVLYNTNDVKKIRNMSREQVKSIKKDDKLIICSVGRICDQKGYDRLLRVTSRLIGEGYPLEVIIVGEGEKRQELRDMVRQEKAEKWFHMVGYCDNPYPYVASSDLFVCSSREEGLSTAVTEAVILGVPVISTDVSGAREILGDNEYGLVCENSEQGLYESIKKVVEDRQLLNYYKKKAKERASFFDTQQTVKSTEELFEAVLSE